MASIKRRADRANRWEVRYRDPAGRQRARLFDRKVDAERYAATTAVDVMRGTYIAPEAGRVTFATYSAEWLASRVHRPTTGARMASSLRVHALPALGARQLSAVRHSEVQAWVRGLSDVLAPASVANVYRTVAAIFSAAVKDRIIAASPCDGVVLPRPTATEVVPPTVAEVGALLDAMPGRYRLAGLLAAGAGLRQGEALGLTLDRVDFLRRTARIDRQLISPPTGAPVFGPTKSEASVRSVPLADVVLCGLAEHVARYPQGPDGLLLTNENGQPMRRNRFGEMWRGSTTRAGLSFRYHDLRHHFASALIAGGCSVKVVQKTLGHASAGETLDTYGHLWPDSEDLTRRAIDAALGSAGAPDVHQMCTNSPATGA